MLRKILIIYIYNIIPSQKETLSLIYNCHKYKHMMYDILLDR